MHNSISLIIKSGEDAGEEHAPAAAPKMTTVINHTHSGDGCHLCLSLGLTHTHKRACRGRIGSSNSDGNGLDLEAILLKID